MIVSLHQKKGDNSPEAREKTDIALLNKKENLSNHSPFYRLDSREVLSQAARGILWKYDFFFSFIGLFWIFHSILPLMLWQFSWFGSIFAPDKSVRCMTGISNYSSSVQFISFFPVSIAGCSPWCTTKKEKKMYFATALFKWLVGREPGLNSIEPKV